MLTQTEPPCIQYEYKYMLMAQPRLVCPPPSVTATATPKRAVVTD
jgi:hypothetical protein